MLCTLFQTRYDILTAYSGQEALKKVAYKPDLILLDIHMPGMDGLTVCQKMCIRDRNNRHLLADLHRIAGEQ